MSRSSKRVSTATSQETPSHLNAPLFDKFSCILKSASSFIDTRLLLLEKGILN
jgi:hypothetical protein